MEKNKKHQNSTTIPSRIITQAPPPIIPLSGAGRTNHTKPNKKPDYRHWIKADYWTLLEAAHLLCDEEPGYFDHLPSSSKGSLAKKINGTYELLERSYKIGNLKSSSGLIYETGFSPQDILEWAEKKGLHIPDGLANTANLEKGLLPCPPGTKWEDITITLIANDTVRIKTPWGEERYTFSELGLSDKRKGDGSTMLWELLKVFAKKGGQVGREKNDYDPKLPDTAKRLNYKLKEIFGINDSIYKSHYKLEKAYITKIHFKDRTYSDADILD